jgi:hypothetical protein
MSRKRVVLEAETEPWANGLFWIGQPDKRALIDPSGPHVVSVEDIPDPEPEWQDGDIVIDGLVITHLRSDDMPNLPWRTFNGVYQKENFPFRPLTLVARDGKPVTR